MSKDKTKNSLSEDAKIARMEQWAIRSRLDKSIVEKLIKKYGPYAYELMRQAQYPGDFNKKTDYPYSSTPQMIKNFLDDEKAPTAEQIAKAVGSNAATVEKTLESVRKIGDAELVVEEATPQEKPTEAFSLTAKQKREMRGWCNLPNVRLSADATITGLVEKYGSLAYDVMEKAIREPSRTMRNIGKAPLKGSKETIQYFLDHADEITPDQLAKISSKSVKEVKQAQPSGREQEMNERVDRRQSEKQKESQEVPEQVGVGAHTSDYKKFRKWCYGQMGKGEGRYNCVTLCDDGHPTTGVGTLICRKEPIKSEWIAYQKNHPKATFREFANSVAATCNDPQKAKNIKSGTVAAWRQKWINEGGNPEIFDNCVVGVASGALVPGGKDVEKINGGGWKVKASANNKYGNISNATMENLFNKRFDECYSQARNKIKNFDAQTDYARETAIHGIYMGYADVIKKGSTINETLTRLGDKYGFIRNDSVRRNLEYAFMEYNIPRTKQLAKYRAPSRIGGTGRA